MADEQTDLTELLGEVADVARPTAADGEVADYIPVLAEADPDAFGIALVDLDGREHLNGDVDQQR